MEPKPLGNNLHPDLFGRAREIALPKRQRLTSQQKNIIIDSIQQLIIQGYTLYDIRTLIKSKYHLTDTNVRKAIELAKKRLQVDYENTDTQARMAELLGALNKARRMAFVAGDYKAVGALVEREAKITGLLRTDIIINKQTNHIDMRTTIPGVNDANQSTYIETVVESNET